MKFSCEKTILYSAISTVSRAVSAKSPIQSLEGILIEAGANLKLSGYDLETGISTTIEAQVEKSGAIILNSRLFGDIIRRLPNDTVNISVDDKNKVTIICGMSKFDIMGMPADDFPELPTVDEENSFSISQGKLKRMISQTIFAISTNESKLIHTGSLFEVENDNLTVVSVDGYRLALRKEKIENNEVSFSFVVPGTALSEVEKIALDSDDPVMITLGKKHIIFKIENTVLVSRRLEGEFLDYKKAIPRKNNVIVYANVSDLISSVDRVSLIINEKAKRPVRCVFSDGVIKLSVITTIGSAYDECTIEGTGNELEIGFNNKYMLDAFKAAPAERVKMELNSSVSPCIIVSEDDSDGFLYMILPVRLKSDV